MKERISPISVASRYKTRVPEWLESDGLRFHWFSWLLCEVQWSAGNLPHLVVCTDFREHKNGFSVDRWNPTYDAGDEHAHHALTAFYSWKPVAIISLEGSNTTKGK